MKWLKISAVVAVVALMAIFVIRNCGDHQTGLSLSQQADSQVPKAQMDISGEDTLAVLDLVRTYVNLQKDRRFREAVDMLYVLDKNERLQPLSAEQRREQMIAMNMFRIYDYEIKRLIFWKETDCKVEYAIRVSPPQDGHVPAQMGCALRPVRHEGCWYLTIANRRSEHKVSEIER